jgi:hypothetical protein
LAGVTGIIFVWLTDFLPGGHAGWVGDARGQDGIEAADFFHLADDGLALLGGERLVVVNGLGRLGGFGRRCRFLALDLGLEGEGFLAELLAAEAAEEFDELFGIVGEIGGIGEEFKEALFQEIGDEEVHGVGLLLVGLGDEFGAVEEMGALVGEEGLDHLMPVTGDGHGGTFDCELGQEALLDDMVGEAVEEPLGEGGLLGGGEVEEFGVGAGFGHGIFFGLGVMGNGTDGSNGNYSQSPIADGTRQMADGRWQMAKCVTA